jgi:2-succinyl-5-enolpyruvyl-6-hydroxy-3-cyclohexene-1-carboxylate synthase
MSTDLITDFEGGSFDFIEDGVELLQEAEKPFVLIVLSNLEGGRIFTHLTPKSKEFLKETILDGTLSNLLLDRLSDLE